MANDVELSELISRPSWRDIQNQLRLKWDELTDEDLDYAEGQQAAWYGHLAGRTGYPLADLRAWFDTTYYSPLTGAGMVELKYRDSWDDIRDQIRLKYDVLTDDDFDYDEGTEDDWYGRIASRAGYPRDDVRTWFNTTYYYQPVARGEKDSPPATRRRVLSPVPAGVRRDL